MTTQSEEDLPRMRIEHGRVMHRVRGRGSTDYVSLCDRPHPVKGVSSRVPRAEGHKSMWSTERHWYPDCSHCPAGEEGKP